MAPPSGQLERLYESPRKQEGGATGKEKGWGRGARESMGEPSQSQVSTRGTDGRKVDPTQKSGVRRTRQTVTSKQRKAFPWPSPALGCCDGAPPPAGYAGASLASAVPGTCQAPS